MFLLAVVHAHHHAVHHAVAHAVRAGPSLSHQLQSISAQLKSVEMQLSALYQAITSPKWTEVAGFRVALASLIVTIIFGLIAAALFCTALLVARRAAMLAAEAAANSALAESRLQAQLTPIVTFDSGNLRVTDGSVETDGARGLSSTIRNVGMGPALNTAMKIEVLNPADEVFASADVSIGPIGAGQALPLSFERQLVYGKESLARQTARCRVRIRYEDLLGAHAQTVHDVPLTDGKEVKTAYDRPAARSTMSDQLPKPWIDALLRT